MTNVMGAVCLEVKDVAKQDKKVYFNSGYFQYSVVLTVRRSDDRKKGCSCLFPAALLPEAKQDTDVVGNCSIRISSGVSSSQQMMFGQRAINLPHGFAVWSKDAETYPSSAVPLVKINGRSAEPLNRCPLFTISDRPILLVTRWDEHWRCRAWYNEKYQNNAWKYDTDFWWCWKTKQNSRFAFSILVI